MSSSLNNISNSTTTSISRMENGDRIPRLAPGVYHKIPTPVLSELDKAIMDNFKKESSLTKLPACGTGAGMRGPPPAWQPPCPPDKDHDYENNYEDPENLQKNKDMSRELLLNNSGPPPMYNSYELSLSQQRRNKPSHANMPGPSMGDDWHGDEIGQRILQKNSEGTYYIPSVAASEHTTVSTLSPCSQIRYQDQCATMLTSGRGTLGSSKGDSATATLVKYNTTASLGRPVANKKRTPKMRDYMEKQEKESSSILKPSVCTAALFAALIISLIIIVLLLLRSPHYVYSELSPAVSKVSHDAFAIDESQLRPLPAVIGIGERIEADMPPKHTVTTELFVSRPVRILFNITLGGGAQMVLLGRHSVPPTLYIHDFFRPLKAYQPTNQKMLTSTNGIGTRVKRMTPLSDITDPRSAVAEEFLLEGRWHLMFINERNRIEPFVLTITSVNSGSSGSSSQFSGSSRTGAGSKFPSSDNQRCEMDCSGHGECINGQCKCVSGYTGDICEDAICPLVCSGNGIFSGGACVCNPGFKGKECDIRLNWCEKPDCSGNGKCSANGKCHCNRGWKGEFCEERDCIPNCANGGVCMKGVCFCANGWSGTDCSKAFASRPFKEPQVEMESAPLYRTPLPSRSVEHRKHVPPQTTTTPKRTSEVKSTTASVITVSTTTESPCSANAHLKGKECVCNQGWTGVHCSEKTCNRCVHGTCQNGKCACQNGYTGQDCSLSACPIGCEDHGECANNGTCVCQKGWNGKNCYLDGCPRSCSGHGDCHFSSTTSTWTCQCQPGRTGQDCAILMELDCRDGLDNDSDELIDCDDPECCNSDVCRDQGACVFSSNPSEVLLRLPGIKNAQFAQRISFLYQNDIQKYADPAKFNDSLVSVVRGRVTWNAGVTNPASVVEVPLAGVRVSDGSVPLWGFTLSRLDGEFDLVVNGGQTIQLRFQRNPFSKVIRNVFVPPNEIFHVGDVHMYTEKSPAPRSTRPRPKCEAFSRTTLLNPIVRTSRDFGTNGATHSGLLVDTRSFVKRVSLPGSSAHLVYDSSRVAAAQSWIVMGLLDDQVDKELRLVHVQIDVAGRRFETKLAPAPNLTYTWAWDKQNVYRQSEHGLVNAHIRIGYEFKECDRPNEIIRYWRTVKTDGAVARGLEGNAWSLDVHHYLDVVNNVVEMGDGGKRFLSDSVRMLETIVGKEAKGSVSCTNCSSSVNAEKAVLLRPSAIAVGREGSFFVGDHNIIKYVSGSTGMVKPILQLSAADTSHSYQMAVNPLDGVLYVSLSFTKQIWKVLSLDPVDISNNHMVFAGDGTACTSHDSACGDGGFAIDAQLITPKGIAFDAQGNLYIADGRKVRMIDASNVIRSIVDSSSNNRPFCGQNRFPISSLQLEWPTSLAVHQSTGRLFILDSNAVYELDYQSSSARIVIGSAPSCPNNSSFVVRFVKDLAVADSGSLFILESDGKHMNQVRHLSQDGNSLKLIAGGTSACGCDIPSCECDDTSNFLPARQARLNSPMAIALTAEGDLLVVDSDNAKIKKVFKTQDLYDPISRLYHVVDVNRKEMYAFNRYGLHAWTQSLVTGKVIYNFTYNVDTSLGRISSIHGAGELLLRFMRPNDTHVTIETPSGQRTHLVHSLYDGTIDSILRSEFGPLRLRYQPGGCLLTQIQDHTSMSIRYDSLGRVQSVRQDGEGYDIHSEKMIDGRYTADVYRNGEYFAHLSMDQDEFSYEDSSLTRLTSLDDGYLLSSNSMVTLLDSYNHPEHGQAAIMKAKISIPAVQNPTRRELTYRFDWRPYIKRNLEKRVAEVGIRPRINGVNTYSVAFDRQMHSDIVRARSNDAVLITIGYTDSGEISSIVLPTPDDALPSVDLVRNLSIVYDSLSRRSEIIWGNLSIQAAYDRQNRVVEYVRMKVSPMRFSYHKDFRHPISVELQGSIKYNIKLDARGHLKDITTPVGEQHSFNSIPIGQEKIILRRYPFTKKPFRLALDSENNVCEWATSDDMHHFVAARDVYGRTESTMCDGILTTFSIDSTLSKPVLIVSPTFKVNLTWQGPLLSSSSNSIIRDKSSTVSSFSYEYDDMFRPVAIHCTVEGVAIESIRMAYDDRLSLLNEIHGYQILREFSSRKIQAQNFNIETKMDPYMRLVSNEAVIGDTKLTQRVIRDISGKVILNEWHSSWGPKKEVYEYDNIGRVASLTSGGVKYMLSYNHDGRPITSNDVTFEWHAGGVPKRVNKTEYVVDGNGWVIKRGNTFFELDCVGRLIGAVLNEGTRFQLTYDYLGRLSTIKRGSLVYSLFYALPNKNYLVTHFTISGAGAATILYDDDDVPFALIRDGYRYALVTDSFGSLRYILSEASIGKELFHNILGAVIVDSDSEFWIPIGFRGGVDIPDLSISILNGRPLDTTLGRFLSFGPDQAHTIKFDSIQTSTDLFSLPRKEETSFPLDIAAWFRVVGFSPDLLPPLPFKNNLSGVMSSRRLSSFPQTFQQFATPMSIAPSALVDIKSSTMLPPNDALYTTDESGFYNLFLLVPDVNTTILEPLPSLSADDEALLTKLFNHTTELNWRQWHSGFERHFVSPSMPSLTSESRAHFTIIVSKNQVELRSGKDKIVVHVGSKQQIEKSLIDDLKRKDGPAVWRSQHRRIERKEMSVQKWTAAQRRDIAVLGSLDDHKLEYANLLNVRFPTVHLWRIVQAN